MMVVERPFVISPGIRISMGSPKTVKVFVGLKNFPFTNAKWEMQSGQHHSKFKKLLTTTSVRGCDLAQASYSTSFANHL